MMTTPSQPSIVRLSYDSCRKTGCGPSCVAALACRACEEFPKPVHAIERTCKGQLLATGVVSAEIHHETRLVQSDPTGLGRAPRPHGAAHRGPPPHARHRDRDRSRGAHDFVWKHDRRPVRPVRLRDRPPRPPTCSSWPYLLHYPGCRDLPAPSRRPPGVWLARAWSSWPTPRSRGRWQAEWPERVRVAPLGSDPGSWPATLDAIESPASRGLTRSGLLDPARRREVVERAARRARQRGAAVTCSTAHPGSCEADVIVALEWPPAAGPPVAALHAMAAGPTGRSCSKSRPPPAGRRSIRRPGSRAGSRPMRRSRCRSTRATKSIR